MTPCSAREPKTPGARPVATLPGVPSRRWLPLGLLLGLVMSLLAATPAQAEPAGEYILGHRCRTYEGSVTDENTVRALVDTSAVAGASCEIDTWALADGTQIVWHDPTWARVADPDTLPAGVRPTDRVTDATWDEVRQIRTNGGAPVARLRQMMHASAEYGVPLVVELRDVAGDPARFVDDAREEGARVRFYEAPGSSCETRALDRLRAAGATTGIKIERYSSCSLTAGQLDAKGATFVTAPMGEVTADFVLSLRLRGIQLYARFPRPDSIPGLVNMGVAGVLVDRPRQAVSWFQ